MHKLCYMYAFMLLRASLDIAYNRPCCIYDLAQYEWCIIVKVCRLMLGAGVLGCNASSSNCSHLVGSAMNIYILCWRIGIGVKGYTNAVWQQASSQKPICQRGLVGLPSTRRGWLKCNPCLASCGRLVLPMAAKLLAR